MGEWLSIPTWLAAELDANGAAAEADDFGVAAEDAMTCQICGDVKPAGVVEQMAVVATQTQDTIVAGFAHRRCAGANSTWRERFAHLGTDGIDATAVFGIRHRPPRAVLAFEPHLRALGVVGSQDTVDLYVCAHLGAGMELVGAELDELDELDVPLARGWLLDTRGGSIALSHRELGTSYEQAVNAGVESWLRFARGAGAALVLTGSGLGLQLGGALPPDFTAARLRGHLVAALVKVR